MKKNQQDTITRGNKTTSVSLKSVF